MIPAVVTVFVAATESLTEIIVVLVSGYVVAVVAIVSILVGIGLSKVVRPAVFAIRLPGPEAFLVTIVNRLAEIICAVPIGLVVTAAAIVAITWSRVEVRITIVIWVTVVLEKYLLLTQALQILFLDTVLCQPILLLQLHRLFL